MKLVMIMQIGFPFHPRSRACGHRVMYCLRVAARSELYASHPAWKRVPAKLLATIFWPFSAISLAIRNGIQQRATLFKMLDAWWLAVSHNVPPIEYFSYHLWEAERRIRIDDYLYWTENGLALSVLNRSSGLRRDPNPVEDKHIFYRHCAKLELPTPEVFCVWEHGTKTFGNYLPERDLWLKPAKGKGGVGSERWRWCGKEYHRDQTVQTPEQMIDHIAGHSISHYKTLVQQVISAHGDHASVIADAPLCARILTGRRRSGKVEVIDAMAVWPRDRAEITQGGHIAMIDLATGHLGKVFEAPEACPSRKMEGRPLPGWSSVMDHVCKGHAGLPHYVFLGWDVAFGREGPVLLETNSGWGSFDFQVVLDRPIADTAFASIAAEYL